MVNPKHANIFVNAGSATAADMMLLIDEARAAAMKAFGYKLVPEVVFLGDDSHIIDRISSEDGELNDSDVSVFSKYELENQPINYIKIIITYKD